MQGSLDVDMLDWRIKTNGRSGGEARDAYRAYR